MFPAHFLGLGEKILVTMRLIAIGFLLCLVSCHPSTEIRSTGTPTRPVEAALDRQFDAAHTFESLKYFTQFWRIDGGPGFDSCLSFIGAEVKPFTTTSSPGNPVVRSQILEDPPVGKIWVPEDAILSLESPEVRILHSYSSTPVMLCQNSFPHDITAPLAYVPGGANDQDYSQIDVRGRIVLCDVPASGAYKIAYDHGAVGVLSAYVPSVNQPSNHPDIIAENGIPYDAEREPFAINVSPRTAGELKKQLRDHQVKVRAQVRASFTEAPLKTLVVEIPGASKPEERIVLVAHLDHYKPGANDNASGSATLLEIFRAIASSIRSGMLPPPARTLTFLWVDEYRGTRSWIKRNPDRLKQVIAVFVLDMVGGDPEKTGGTFRVERMPDPGTIWFQPPEQHSGWGVGTWDKRRLFGSFLNDYYLSLVQERSAMTGWKTASNVWEGGSDHDPFLLEEIPAVLSWHFPDFAYHSSMDEVSNISKLEMKNAGVTIGTAAFQLALGSEDLARSTLQAVRAASIKRLDFVKTEAETELEDAQIQGARELDATKKVQKEILDAWASWYDQALESVLAIPAQSPSAAFESEVHGERALLQKNVTDMKIALGL